jgi:hypothetical protein
MELASERGHHRVAAAARLVGLERQRNKSRVPRSLNEGSGFDCISGESSVSGETGRSSCRHCGRKGAERSFGT